MTQKIQESPTESKDVRVTATSIIWGIAVGMLAICIPLSSATKSGSILPLATMTAAAIGTVAVWRSDDKKSTKNSLLPQNVELLEQRIANLETIVTRDDFDLRMKIKQVESRDRVARPTAQSRGATLPQIGDLGKPVLKEQASQYTDERKSDK